MSLRVSAIQLAFSYAATPQEFFDRVGASIDRAAGLYRADAFGCCDAGRARVDAARRHRARAGLCHRRGDAARGVWDDETIFMAQTKTHDREEAIAAKLDLAHLRQWRAAHPRDYNAALYRKYLPRSYEMYRVRAAQHGKRTIT